MASDNLKVDVRCWRKVRLFRNFGSFVFLAFRHPQFGVRAIVSTINYILAGTTTGLSMLNRDSNSGVPPKHSNITVDQLPDGIPFFPKLLNLLAVALVPRAVYAVDQPYVLWAIEKAGSKTV